MHASRPWGVQWRSSAWFTTFVVGCGIATDTVVYSLPVPVVPFQLQKLHYHHVSELSGWLLFAFSAGSVISTFPVAMISERYSFRQPPLLFGLLLLIASQIIFMEAPHYWVMVIARVLQGCSATIVWVVGLALLCDAVPEQDVGKQLGLAMAGIPIGLMLGAPLGGILYTKFGFRGPFIFGCLLAVFDIVGRLLVIERKDAIRWLRPTPILESPHNCTHFGEPAVEDHELASIPSVSSGSTDPTRSFILEADVEPMPRLSFVQALRNLSTSPRALSLMFCVFAVQMSFTMTEPTMPLRLQHVWQLNPTQVGLVTIATVVPALISSPLGGWASDRFSAQWVIITCTFLGIPWWAVALATRSLPVFIFAILMLSFWITAFLSGAVAEIASLSQGRTGVGYAHAYGAFQLATSIGNAVGPLLGGELYDNVRHGWAALCLIAGSLFGVCSVVATFFSGKGFPTLRKRI